MPSAVAFDLEWYAAGPPVPLPAGDGYEQVGVVHGIVELPGGALRSDRGAVAPLAPLGAARSARSSCRRPTPTPGCGRRSPSPTAPSPTGCSPLTAGGLVLRRRLADRRRRGRRPDAAPARAGGATGPARRARATVRTNGAMAASTRTIANSPPTKAPHPAAAASTIPGRSSSASSASGVAVTSTVSVDMVTRSSSACCDARSTSRSVSRRVSSASSRTMLSMSVGLGVERPHPLDAGPQVGDAGVEVGELVGDVLGELVEGQDRAELLEGVGDGRQLIGRDLQHERGAGAGGRRRPRPAGRSRCRRRRPARRAS